VVSNKYAKRATVPIGSLLPANSPRSHGEDDEHIQRLAEDEAELPPILVQHEEGLRFRMLGRFQAEHDGQLLHLGRLAERRLLSFMLLEPNTAIPVERLANLLWNDRPPASWPATLHTYISRLRKSLSSHAFDISLSHSRVSYIAEIDPSIIDIHQFRSIVEHARDISDAHDRSTSLRAALALWRGPLLVDVLADDLRQRLGEPWEELRLSALEAAVDAELACGVHLGIISELAGLVSEHPYHENFATALMTALERSNRRADALEVYARLRGKLRSDLGLDPGPEARALHQHILAGSRDGTETRSGSRA
jgi:DNA-binding SARP family transcriptional activator